MCNEYAYQVAKSLIWPDLTVEFAADIINGNVYGSEIWDEVCTLTGGWCNDANVFVAWDKMGRPDEWEHDGHTFQVFQDIDSECPTEWIDSADALCVIGGPHGCILHHPAKTDCPAMWEFDNFHEEHGRTPTQEEWAARCPDYWVYVGWHSMDANRLFAAA